MVRRGELGSTSYGGRMVRRVARGRVNVEHVRRGVGSRLTAARSLTLVTSLPSATRSSSKLSRVPGQGNPAQRSVLPRVPS